MSKQSQATMMVAAFQTEGAALWHSNGVAFATVPVGNHRENLRLRSGAFRAWLNRLAYTTFGTAPGAQAVADATTVLEGMALFASPEFPTYLRIARDKHGVCLDLADEEWRVVEIDANGWRVTPDSPVLFRRHRAMQSLPLPEKGGNIDLLRCLLHVPDSDWPLFAAWLVQAGNPDGPYPILILHGEQGSAKTTASRVLKRLIDPNAADLRAEPREARDLAIAATNSWIIGLDNVSSLPGWLSDTLCCLSTGGGFAARQLYTDDEEAIFSFKRPVILNGIVEFVRRGDLADRAIFSTLEPIPEDRRLPETVLWQQFAGLHPRILGALCDAISTALKRKPFVSLDRLPRMADFAIWVAAAEPALGLEENAFMSAYAANRADAIEATLDSSFARWVRLMGAKGFEGTASDLFDLAGDDLQRRKDWPKTPRSLSGELRRIAPALRAVGVGVSFSRTSGSGSQRMITLEQVPETPSLPSPSSQGSIFESEERAAGATQILGLATQGDAALASEQVQCDGSDDSDAKSRTHSNGTYACSLCERTTPCEMCREDAASHDGEMWSTMAL